MGGPLICHPLISLGIQAHCMPLCHYRQFRVPVLPFRHTIFTSRLWTPVASFTPRHTIQPNTLFIQFPLRKKKVFYDLILSSGWVCFLTSCISSEKWWQKPGWRHLICSFCFNTLEALSQENESVWKFCPSSFPGLKKTKLLITVFFLRLKNWIDQYSWLELYVAQPVSSVL